MNCRQLDRIADHLGLFWSQRPITCMVSMPRSSAVAVSMLRLPMLSRPPGSGFEASYSATTHLMSPATRSLVESRTVRQDARGAITLFTQRISRAVVRAARQSIFKEGQRLHRC